MPIWLSTIRGASTKDQLPKSPVMFRAADEARKIAAAKRKEPNVGQVLLAGFTVDGLRDKASMLGFAATIEPSI